MATKNKSQKTVYDRYNDTIWKNVLTFIKNQDTNDIEELWKKIIHDELFVTKNRKTFSYILNGMVHEGGNFKEFLSVFALSRAPIMNLIKANQYDAVAEFGSGWGRNLFHLFSQGISTHPDYYGFEYTDSGLKCHETIYKKTNPEHRLTIQPFDYNKPKIKLAKKYQNMLAFTCWSIEQITNIKKEFFNRLLDSADSLTCVHIEPVGWQIPTNYCPQSVEFRHFNKNLVRMLKELELEKKITIDVIVPEYFNFFNNIATGTLIIWRKI